MAVEVIRKLINGAWRTVAEDAGGNGGSQPFSGALVTGMDETNTANPSGLILVVCPATVYDTDGYVVDGGVITDLTAPTDGIFLVTLNILLTAPGAWLEVLLQNNGTDNIAFATFTGTADPLWATITQQVRLTAGADISAGINYDHAATDVRAQIGAGSVGGFAISKIGEYPA